MREQDIERALVEHVRRLGGYAVKLIDPSRRGAPDRLVLLPGGQVIFVELKSRTGVVSPHQQRYHDDLRAVGHTVQVVRSVAEIAEVLS